MSQELNHDTHRDSGTHADAQYPYSGLSLIDTQGLQTVSVTDHMEKLMITIVMMRLIALTFIMILYRNIMKTILLTLCDEK